MKTFTLVFSGSKVSAIAQDGSELASFTQKDILRARSNSGHDLHRSIVEGSSVALAGWKHEAQGLASQVLDAIESQLPEAFVKAGWKFSRVTVDSSIAGTADQQNAWNRFDFLRGLCAGQTAWFGMTAKPVVAAVKKAQKNLSFKLAA